MPAADATDQRPAGPRADRSARAGGGRDGDPEHHSLAGARPAARHALDLPSGEGAAGAMGNCAALRRGAGLSRLGWVARRRSGTTSSKSRRCGPLASGWAPSAGASWGGAAGIDRCRSPLLSETPRNPGSPRSRRHRRGASHRRPAAFAGWSETDGRPRTMRRLLMALLLLVEPQGCRAGRRGPACASVAECLARHHRPCLSPCADSGRLRQSIPLAGASAGRGAASRWWCPTARPRCGQNLRAFDSAFGCRSAADDPGAVGPISPKRPAGSAETAWMWSGHMRSPGRPD